MLELATLIQTRIKQEVENHRERFRFREPIVGFAAANDPLYQQLSDIIGTKQLHPRIFCLQRKQ